MFKIESEGFVSTDGLTQHRGIAYDGDYFYLTERNKRKVMRFDPHFQNEEWLDADRCYTYLCYDFREACFWAFANQDSCRIFKLNKSFEEMECINVPDCCGCEEQFLGDFVECPYYICSGIVADRKALRIYTHSRDLVGETPIPEEWTIHSAVLFPRAEDTCRCTFYAVLSQCDGDSRIVYGSMDGSMDGSMQYKPIPFQESPCPCDEDDHCCDCEEDPCCDCEDDHCCDCEEDDCCDCEDDHCHHCEDDHCCRSRCCCDLLESIAMVETSISHILNAEGEKIQKVVAMSNNVCEMLQVNKTVNEMVVSVTHLEHVLYDKLKAVMEDCGCKR